MRQAIVRDQYCHLGLMNLGLMKPNTKGFFSNAFWQFLDLSQKRKEILIHTGWVEQKVNQATKSTYSLKADWATGSTNCNLLTYKNL